MPSRIIPGTGYTTINKIDQVLYLMEGTRQQTTLNEQEKYHSAVCAMQRIKTE